MSLHKLLDTTEQLTFLSLPERAALVDEISKVVPAGNVPGMVVAGLANLPDRAVPVAETRRNLSMLMQGMQTFLDKAVYQAFFVGPATVLSAYQMLLQLAGKDVEKSFPEGTWQFYVEFGLREDSGRHTCETVGFQEALRRENIHLDIADEMAAWVATSAWLLDNYPALLDYEWMDKTRLRFLADSIPDPALLGRWLKIRPYSVPVNVQTDFPEYRRKAFENFCQSELEKIPIRYRQRIEKAWEEKRAGPQFASELAAYQNQMTILSTINPGEHSDTRVGLPRAQVCVAVIANGRYYLIDIGGPVSAERARSICNAILYNKPDAPPPSLDKLLSGAFRRDQIALRKLLPETTSAELARLRQAPIILNWDTAQSNQPLANIRSGRRGIGDHPMTVFRCTQGFVYDLSHIYFDGAWGMAIAEIMTSQAVRFARHLAKLPKPTSIPEVASLKLEAPHELVAQARKVQLPAEISAETTKVRCDLLQRAQRNLKARNDKLRLTINDILILYRSLFGHMYQPSTALIRSLDGLDTSTDPKIRAASALARSALELARQPNPALLIPIDASGVSPRERVFPMIFRNLFPDLWKHHRNTLTALDTLDSAEAQSRAVLHRQFEEARREYLAMMYAFAQLIRRSKEVSLKGESISTSSIKLLGGLPSSIQHMLDGLPGRFDIVNDVIKGQEVFSNVGQVSLSSSLTRFTTAKDDNEKKVMAWGVMTDAAGMVRISLRDSRPHVSALIGVQQHTLARQITDEYLDSFAVNLNSFANELTRITRAGSHGTGPLRAGIT